MAIQNIKNRHTGHILYEGVFENIRNALEQAVADKICLDFADLSGANLANAALDGAFLRNADFQNANLAGANLSETCMDGADFTGAYLAGACLCHSSLRDCLFDDAAFGATDISGSDIGGSLFSGPSAFSLNFIDTAGMKECRYRTHGQDICMMSRPPVVISGLREKMAFMDDHVLIGSELHLLLPRSNDNFLRKKLDINFIQLYK